MADDNMDVETSILDKIHMASGKQGFPRLQKCTVQLPCENGLTNTDGQLGDTSVDSLVDLSFLNALRGGDDDFVPERLFLHQEVQDMFTKLAAPHERRLQRRILTGSPGVGKSLVFFLAALQIAFTMQTRVIYVRNVEEEKRFSIFVMEKNPDGGGKVDVAFGLDISKLDVAQNHAVSMVVAVIQASGLRAMCFYKMVDGPKHNAPDYDFLYGDYEALCTSGGYPAPKQAAIGKEKILVMSGWTEKTLKLAMGHLNIAQVDKKYELAGGRIRLVLVSEDEIKSWFDSIIQSIGQDAVVLAITSDVATGCLEIEDWLRTRFFEDQNGTINSRMIVDSRYAFNKLKQRLGVAEILAAYKLAWGLELKAASGWFYEEILHRQCKELTKPLDPMMPPRIKEWIHEENITGAQGIASLVAKCRESTDIYWCPPISNFCNIDAAVYHHSRTLLCYQYTVQSTHTFDRGTFWTDFVNHLVIGQVPIKRVRVVFVTPLEVSFDLRPHPSYKENVSTGLQQIPVRFLHVSLPATSSINKVAGSLLNVNET